jgi:hypothetical protein
MADAHSHAHVPDFHIVNTLNAIHLALDCLPEIVASCSRPTTKLLLRPVGQRANTFNAPADERIWCNTFSRPKLSKDRPESGSLYWMPCLGICSLVLPGHRYAHCGGQASEVKENKEQGNICGLGRQTKNVQ